MPEPRAPTLEEVLGPGGRLSRALPGWEPRDDQVAMGAAVARAIERHGYLVAEAGTGTGKTLAYLVPAALSGRRVVVSTATKTLQEQIWWKDLPLLRESCGLRQSRMLFPFLALLARAKRDRPSPRARTISGRAPQSMDIGSLAATLPGLSAACCRTSSGRSRRHPACRPATR